MWGAVGLKPGSDLFDTLLDFLWFLSSLWLWPGAVLLDKPSSRDFWVIKPEKVRFVKITCSGIWLLLKTLGLNPLKNNDKRRNNITFGYPVHMLLSEVKLLYICILSPTDWPPHWLLITLIYGPFGSCFHHEFNFF